MASLNTEIKLGRSQKFPSKKSINLLIREKHTRQNVAALLLFGVYLVLLYFFVRYGVQAQLAKIDSLQAAYNRMEDMVEDAKAANSDYEAVRAEYSHYGNGYLNDEEKAEQDRMEILQIIEDNLFDKDALQTISITGNVATLTINSEKLANVSEIVQKLEEEDIVSYVTVTNAEGSQSQRAREEAEEEGESAEDAERNVTSTMTIFFKDANAEEEAAAESTAAESTEASTESTAAENTETAAAESQPAE